MWFSRGWAQTSLVSGALEGSVSDSSGGRIPGARVRAREVETHLAREVSTNEDGSFRISGLPPGTYEVSATQAGLGRYRHEGVILPPGSTLHLYTPSSEQGSHRSPGFLEPLTGTGARRIQFSLDFEF